MASGREYTQLILTICCVATLILSAVSLPALSGAPTTSTEGPPQSEDSQPGTGAQGESGTPTATGQSAGGDAQARGERSGGGGGLGALSTGEQTTVGGNRSTFSSTGQQVHFTVSSSEPSYWRTSAYKEYTGSGWRQQGEESAYDGGEIPGDTEGQNRVVQTYRLNRSGNSLPAAWRPIVVSGSESDIRVTDQQALRTATRFERGLTYDVLSYTPPRDPDRLRESGYSYPASVENQYTQLPQSTRTQLEPVTRQIVGDPDSPYTAAVRIEEWLETNKEYSLNASHDPGTDIATEFVMNMDRGYCEYFATAMVAMLRSQDIPARYVTGYSTGQPVGEDKYIVRGMNAHAWVEVYFEDIGWVRFDPTPGSARLDAEAQAYAQASSGGSGGSGGESGSVGSTPGGSAGSGSASGADGTVTAAGSSTQSSDAASEYRHREVGSPGETMGSAGTSGSGSEQTTDGDSESTDGSQDGQSSRSDDRSSSEESGSDGQSSEESGSDGQSPEESGSDHETPEPDDEDQSENGAIPPLGTELNRTELVPGTDVQVTVTRAGEPVEGVTVRFNGDAVGDTAPDGTVVGTVPYAEALNVTVATGQDAQSLGGAPPVARSVYFDIREPSVGALDSPATDPAPSDVDTYEVETNATVDVANPPIPNSPVVVTAIINGTPIPGATLSVGGSPAGETNQSGQAKITLPADVEQTQIQVTRGAVTGARELTLLTQLNVSVAGDFYPRGDAAVTVTARGTSVANATVTIGDGVLGRTTTSGTVAGQFPGTTGNVTVTATKGIAEGTRRLELRELAVRATPESVLPFPWTGVTVQSRLEDEPAGGVEIRLNGRPVGETSPGGTLNATLPPTYGVTVTAVGYGQRVSTAAGNPVAVLLGTVAVGLLVVGAVARRGRRSDRTTRGVLTAALTAVVRLTQRLFGGIVSFSSRVDDFVRWIAGIARRLRKDVTAIPQLLAQWVRRARRRSSAVAGRIRRSLSRIATWVTRMIRSVSTVIRNPKRSVVLCLGWLRRLFESAESTTTGGDAAAPGTTREESEEAESRLTVREAWREFLGYVSVRRWRTKTPGQISRRAIESDGLPPEAVKLLTDSFREVEYGDRSAQDSVAGAQDALERIKRAVRAETEDDDS